MHAEHFYSFLASQPVSDRAGLVILAASYYYLAASQPDQNLATIKFIVYVT